MIKAINQTKVRRSLLRLITRLRLVWIILLSSLLLSGCVQYEVGVNFDSAYHGEIVQHIKLGERLNRLSGDTAKEWLNSIERRARVLDGTTKRISAEEIAVTIPFNNAEELQAKFNEFFQAPSNQSSEVKQVSEIAELNSQINLTQSNFLVLLQNRLRYDLDLRSLALISPDSNVLVDPSQILDLKFKLNTPWGAKSVAENTIAPETFGKQLVWTLKPGQLNHLEAVFWLPNPIGIGSIAIILFVAAGMYLRYSFMPDPATIQFKRQVATVKQPQT